MGRSWKEISVSGAHNREWTGDPAYRYTARVNGTGTSDIFAETNSCKIATLSRSGRACRLADRSEIGRACRADCEHDMGLSSSDMTDLQNTWAQMMNLTQAKVLEKGGFDWRMCVTKPAP